MTQLTGTFTRTDGTPDTGIVTIRLTDTTVRDTELGPITHTTAPITARLDTEGKVDLHVIGTDDPGWRTPITHTVRITTRGTNHTFTTTGIAGDHVDLEDLADPRTRT